RSVPGRGRPGRRCSSLRSPLFAPLQGGLQGLGAGLEDEVAQGELGGAEELAVGLGGEQFSHLLDVGIEGGTQGLVNPVSFSLLRRGEGGAGHGGLLRVSAPRPVSPKSAQDSTVFYDALPTGPSPRDFSGPRRREGGQ